MSEAKKVAIGVVGGILGISAFFALVLMIVGKGDEPPHHPQPIVAEQPKPIPPKPAQVQPQPLLAEQPQPEPRAVSSAGPITQEPDKASTSTSDAQETASSTRTEPNPTPEEHPAPPSVANQAPSGDIPNGTTATGIPTYVGPRGGVYHYSASGKKVYQRRGK